jgi:hypothetical protein
MLEVPISVFGEASGMVYMQGKSGKKGLGRVLVCFYDKQGRFMNKTLTEPDGYFSYLGLPPGSYIARVDTSQLRKINMIASPEILEFEMEIGEDGSVIDNLEFTLSTLFPETGNIPEPVRPSQSIETGSVNEPIQPSAAQKEIKEPDPPIKSEEKGDQSLDNKVNRSEVEGRVPAGSRLPIVAEPAVKAVEDIPGEFLNPPQKGSYMIQTGAYSLAANAVQAATNLKQTGIYAFYIRKENKLFKLMITGYPNMNKAKAILPEIRKNGFNTAYILKFE